ncbi:hypothetical protein L1047_00860 [Synechococcus sp. Nb3U1]|uniref:hypothetical protein n=1 Tax=Synechococcus sp. Nb3U1 TaxID=1914529 RepID=UPI001F20C6D7|nr:hypothetical protein [Synechococcus sp. Nb3U1]MCF2969746.1 hypothetical protein [Synechococcus sp. Nb3U1]
MSEAGVTRAALMVAALVVSTVLGPRVALPWVAGVALLILEQVALGGRLSGLLGAWLDWASPQYRQRVIRHEAGHMVVAYLLGIPLVGYVLNPWQAFRRGIPGYGGVELDQAPIRCWQAQGGIPWGDVDRYGTFWMAGAAAETLHYGHADGDAQDRQQVIRLLSGIPSAHPWVTSAKLKAQLNRFLRQSQALLQAHPETYAIVVQHLEQGSPWQDCMAALAASLEQEANQEV